MAKANHRIGMQSDLPTNERYIGAKRFVLFLAQPIHFPKESEFNPKSHLKIIQAMRFESVACPLLANDWLTIGVSFPNLFEN